MSPWCACLCQDVVCHLQLKLGMKAPKDHLSGLPKHQTYFSLPPLRSSNFASLWWLGSVTSASIEPLFCASDLLAWGAIVARLTLVKGRPCCWAHAWFPLVWPWTEATSSHLVYFYMLCPNWGSTAWQEHFANSIQFPAADGMACSRILRVCNATFLLNPARVSACISLCQRLL